MPVTLQFRLRTIFFLTALSSVVALTLSASTWLAALGVGLAILIGRCALAMRAVRFRIAMQLVLILFSIGMLWINGVDRSIWYEYCPICGDHRFIVETRICGIAIFTNTGMMHEGNQSLMRTDLGKPCAHTFESEHASRVWGLLLVGKPYPRIMPGCASTHICCFGRDEAYYDIPTRKRVQKFAKENPAIASQLFERIVEKDDFDLMHQLIEAGKSDELDDSTFSQISAVEQTDPAKRLATELAAP